jgi:hypothetical protein
MYYESWDRNDFEPIIHSLCDRTGSLSFEKHAGISSLNYALGGSLIIPVFSISEKYISAD